MIPLSQQFHPVFIAAAYLLFIKNDLNRRLSKTKGGLEPIPEEIGGHPWYQYVDQAIEPTQLQFVTGVLEYYDQVLNNQLKLRDSNADVDAQK